MNTTILNILCEGQTEEKFVKEVLKPHFVSHGIVVKSRLLVTSRKKGTQGGMISYTQAKNDLTRWMKEVEQRGSETHFFTTMFDFYALPNEFPNMVQAASISDPYLRIASIEEAFKRDMGSDRFIPYIQLHEFEALMFCDITKLAIEYPKCIKEIESLESVLAKYNGNPELINIIQRLLQAKESLLQLKGSVSINITNLEADPL